MSTGSVLSPLLYSHIALSLPWAPSANPLSGFIDLLVLEQPAQYHPAHVMHYYKVLIASSDLHVPRHVRQRAPIFGSSEAFNEFQLSDRLGQIRCLPWLCYWEITGNGFSASMTSVVL